MITDLVINKDLGLLVTNNQFVLIIKDNIYGPFQNRNYKKVINALKIKEENDNE